MAKNEKKKGMNLPNKITCIRLIVAVIVLVILCMPWSAIGVEWKRYSLKGFSQDIDLKFIVAGVLFAIGSFTDFLDGFIARKYNLVTDFGKVMDAIADKILVNGVLIILATEGYISVIIPVVIVSRDIIVDSIKMVAGQKNGAVGASYAGKVKTAFMMVGITLLFFYNLPFSLINIYPAEVIIMIATILSVISGVQYYIKNKKYLSK